MPEGNTGSGTVQGPGRNAWEQWLLGGRKGPMPRGTDSEGNKLTGTGLDNIDLPDPGNVATSDTGVSGAGGAGTETGQAQEFIDAVGTEAAEGHESAVTQQGRAQDLSDDIGAQVDESGERIGAIQDDLTTRQEDLDTQINNTFERLDTLADDATSQFDRLKTEFGDLGTAALGRVDDARQEAVGQVMEGRSAAMQAAVQGIQGNVASQIAKIQSNPNLTAGQKQSMIAQTQLAGASAMAPAIGQTILGFNTLAADVQTKFGTIAGNLEGAVLGEMGAFGRQEADAFAQATVASQEISTQLLGVQANSNAAHATAQATLEGIRTQAEMSGNQLLLENQPNLQDPVLNITDQAAATMTLGTDLFNRQFSRDSIRVEQQLTMEVLRSIVGTPFSRMIEGFFGGIAKFGDLKGGLLGALGGAA